MWWGWRIFVVVFLTMTTLVGGVAYIFSFLFRRRLISFFVIYAVLSGSLVFIAPKFDRVALACVPEPGRMSVQSPLFCATNRHYVRPELKVLADDIASVFPKIRALDAGFPLPDGYALLPHLSHHDGRKMDLAFAYAATPPFGLGYWHFIDGPTECPDTWLSLRWDMDWLNWAERDVPVDLDTTTALLRWMSIEPRVDRIFLEPHLKSAWGMTSDKISFQGCRAARHDDHIHIEIAGS